MDSIHNYRNLSIIRSIAGWLRFFNLDPVPRPASLIRAVPALRDEAATGVSYFQERTFVDVSGLSAKGHFRVHAVQQTVFLFGPAPRSIPGAVATTVIAVPPHDDAAVLSRGGAARRPLSGGPLPTTSNCPAVNRSYGQLETTA